MGGKLREDGKDIFPPPFPTTLGDAAVYLSIFTHKLLNPFPFIPPTFEQDFPPLLVWHSNMKLLKYAIHSIKADQSFFLQMFFPGYLHYL